MSARWKYQIRIYLDGHLAEAARFDPGSQKLKGLSSVLAKHRAKLRCQFDLFAEYVAEAERVGTEDYHLYEWTKATIEDPIKRAKYIESFSLYVDDQEVYAKEIADALEADLTPLVENGQIRRAAHTNGLGSAANLRASLRSRIFQYPKFASGSAQRPVAYPRRPVRIPARSGFTSACKMLDLNEMGYVEGRSVAVEFRFAGGHPDRMPVLFMELTGRQVAVMVGGTLC